MKPREEKISYLFSIVVLLFTNCTTNSIFQNHITNVQQDNTKEIQDIIDRLYSLKSNTLNLKKGVYYISQLEIFSGLHIKGEKGTILKMLPKQGKWVRMLNTKKYQWNSDKDSPTIVIQNLNFDGNRKKQGAYTNYQLEHQAMIFLAANPNSKGRLRVEIKNCHFEEGVGDAISVHTNVDVKIKNCAAFNVFRGGLVVTGGNSKVDVVNFKASGDIHKTGIDIEVDGPGYEQSLAVFFNAKNMEIKGDLDVGINGGNVFMDGISVQNPPYRFYAKKGIIIIKNSIFHGGSRDESSIYYPQNILFEKCKFYIKPNTENQVCVNIIWSTRYNKGRNERLTFKQCDFIGTPSEFSTKAIYSNADIRERDNILELDGCTIDSSLTYGIYQKQGGNIVIRRSKIASKYGVHLVSTNNKSHEYRYSLKIVDSDLSQTKESIETNSRYKSLIKITNSSM